MKKYRIIFHIDLNAFYASCESAADPSLKAYPIGIGKNSDRGILTTANYEARKYGVRSAMNVQEAKRLCPQLKVISPNFALYEHYSKVFFDYLETFTTMIEPASIDEGYLDMTDDLNGKHPFDLAEEIQDYLHKTHDLPVSIGIAPNMFLAKMASDMKKPLGITVLRKRDVEEKLWPLPIESLHGIGKKTVPNLKLLGIQTIGDLANFHNPEKLINFLGNQAESFIEKAKGNDERLVDPTRKERTDSVGNSKTYEGYLHDYEEMIKALESLTKTVVNRLENHELAAKTLSVQVRYNDFESHSKSFTMPYHSNQQQVLMIEVERLFDEIYQEKPVHLLGVSTSNLEKNAMLFKQLNIFEANPSTPKDEAVDKILDSINKHYKKDILNKGLKRKG